MKYTVERCLTGYVITQDKSLYEAVYMSGTENCPKMIYAFSCKEHVLDFLRKALALDNEIGLAKDRIK